MNGKPGSKRQQGTQPYDPFSRGSLPVGVRTIDAVDFRRDRRFPCEIWYPLAPEYAGQDLEPATQDSFVRPLSERQDCQLAVRDAPFRPGKYPLIIFSHSSGGDRRQSTFLCTHLSSHGYVVAALNHSELVATDLKRRDGETLEQKMRRAEAWIANRVPDISFLLDHLLGSASAVNAIINPSLIGLVGHSFGGWTVLAAPDTESRIRAVVALAPGGASKRKPGIIPATLTFDWRRDVPTLYLVAENDSALPLDGMYEIFQRTPATKLMLILRHADHAHFMDNVEELHEGARKMPYPGSEEMLPISELCSGEQAHFFRGLTVCHMDATLREVDAARQFLNGPLEAGLRERNIDILVKRS